MLGFQSCFACVRVSIFQSCNNRDSHMESCGNQKILIGSIKLAWYYSIWLELKSKGCLFGVHVTLLRGRIGTSYQLCFLTFSFRPGGTESPKNNVFCPLDHKRSWVQTQWCANETHVGLLAMSKLDLGMLMACQVKSPIVFPKHTHTHIHISMSFIYQIKHIKTLSFIIINSFREIFPIRHVWASDWSRV